MSMNFLPVLAMAMLAFAVVGCSGDGANSTESRGTSGTKAEVFGGPSQDAFFAPYQGKWKLESRAFDPPREGNLSTIGSDLNITGHIIQIGSGPTCFRLCQSRKVDGAIESDALRVEDSTDAGDVQRFECKLRIVGENLEFRFRSVDSDQPLVDPIVAAADYVPPMRPVAPDAPWWIETYSRKTGE